MSADEQVRADRPWGSWQVLDAGDGFKVKRIEVQPGHRLSYQTHSRRSEHWVVVAGTATCLLDGEVVVARTGQHVVVGEGVAHRVSNDHGELLVIVETQLGAYTEEDDIVRLEDDYDRCETP